MTPQGALVIDRLDAANSLGLMIDQALAVHPGHGAFRYNGAHRTRGQIRGAANDIAARLRKVGVVAGEPVTVEIDHSFELIVCMLGVLIAGGCAVPIDPSLPDQRKEAIRADASPRVLITRPKTGDIDIATTSHQPQRAPDPDLAFIVYTSGSSGGPKGVEITHESYVDRMKNIMSMAAGASKDVDLAWTPSSFIGMLDEFFYPLLTGGTAVIAAPDMRKDPRAFGDFIKREGITVFRITPSLLDLFLRSGIAPLLSGIRAIYCSGETLPAAVQQAVHELLNAQIIGFYGATEAPGVAFHAYDFTAPPLAETICTPQAFAKIRIMQGDDREPPLGEVGEIWVGGCAVARGYWNKPDLSAEKFILSKGVRWYRTGDLGRQLADGQIEVLGRVDASEVNISGVRVNLSEARSAMRALPDVTEAWISVVDTKDGRDRVIIGHVVMHSGVDFDPAATRKALSLGLSAPAVPRFVINHDTFPLTANGKLDVQFLLHQATTLMGPTSSASATTNDPLTTEIEHLLKVVIETTEQVLGTTGLSAQDNFFAVGGNSLLAVHLALALSEKLGVELKTTLVVNTNILGDIAKAVASGQGHAPATLGVLRDGPTDAPPLFTVNATGSYRRLLPHLDEGYPVYNLNMFGFTNELLDNIDTFTLEDLAARFAAQVVEAHPTGECRLMAFCQDGCLAIETARILQDEHAIPCTLLLIDTYFIEHRVSPWMTFMRLFDLGPRFYLDKFRAKRNPVTKPDRFEDMPLAQRAALLEKSQNDAKLYRRFTDLFMPYEPAAYDGDAVLFMSQDWWRANLACVRTMTDIRLSLVRVKGLHSTLLSAEHVSELAASINTTLLET